MFNSQTDHDGQTDELLGQLTAEFLDRAAAGENPSIEDYAERHPEIAPLIRDIFPLLDFIQAPLSEAQSSTELESIPIAALKQLGDFQLLRELGRGGMGVVYEAQQLSMQRKVALKLLPFATLLDSARLKRFKNEVLAAASLDHPNIVSVYSVGEERGIHYYAMQLIQGPTLAQVIDDLRQQKKTVRAFDDTSNQAVVDASHFASNHPHNRRLRSGKTATTIAVRADEETLPENSVPSVGRHASREYYRNIAAIGIQLTRGLTHAHQQGVLHRDIKPANILLDDNLQPYIADFGMAQIESQTPLTMTGDMLGTLRYMSPEQASGQGVLDSRSDIYSLGVTLYELLTLEPAFPATERKALLHQVIQSAPLSPRRVARTVPVELESIVLTAMAERLEDRYATAELLTTDLQRFLDGKPTLAKPPSLLSRAVKWSSRNPTLVGAALALMFVVMLASGLSNFFLRQARIQAEQAQQQAAVEAENASRSAASAEAINQFLTDYVLARAAPSPGADFEAADTESGNAFRAALDGAALYADRKFPDDPELKGALYRTIAQVYARLGDYQRSESQLRKALELVPSNERRAAERLKIMNDLGAVLSQLGKLKEAEDILRESISQAESALGDADPVIIQGRLHLSKVLIGRNKLDQAEALARKCLQPSVAGTEESSIDSSFAQIALAQVLIARGNRVEAEPMLSEAIGRLRVELGSEDLAVQEAMLALAKIYKQGDNLEASELVYREVLDARLRVQGSKHALTTAVMLELADLLYVQERYPEVETVLKQVLKTQRTTTTSAYASSRNTASRLAQVLWKQGRLVEAKEYLGVAERNVSPDDDLGDLETVLQYADILNSVGDYEPAEDLLRTTWETITREHGAQHPAAAVCLNRLVFSLLAQRKVVEAEALVLPNLNLLGHSGGPSTGFAEMNGMKGIADHSATPYNEGLLIASLEYKRETLPQSHLSIATTLSILAQDLISNRRHEEAEAYLRECLQIRQRGLPAGHWLVAETQNLLGGCLTHLGQLADAEKLLLESCEGIDERSAITTAQQSEWIDRVCDLYDVMDSPEKGRLWGERSAKLLGELLDDWEKIAKPTDSFFTNAQVRYGRRLLELGRFEEAELVLLKRCAMHAIGAGWRANAYMATAADDSRQELMRLYTRWNRVEEGERWQTLIELSPGRSDFAPLACHRQGILIWSAVTKRFDEPVFKARLARAFIDAADNYVRIGRPQQAELGSRKAIETLQTLVDADGSDTEASRLLVFARLSLADALTQLERYSDALECYEAAIAANQDRTAVLREFSWFLVDCPDSNLRSPERVLETRSADTDLQREIKLTPVAAVAHCLLGNPQAAIELLEGGPQRSERLCILAMAHHQLGDRDAALYHYNLAVSRKEGLIVRRGPNQSTNWSWERWVDRVQQLAEETLELSTSQRGAMAAYWRGMAYYEETEFALACDSLRTAIELNPEYAEAHLGLSQALLEASPGNIDDATQAIDQYFALYPKNVPADAYMVLGQVRTMGGSIDEGILNLRQSIDIYEQQDAPNGWAHYNLGEALSQRGDVREAIEQFELAISLLPEQPSVKATLAWLLVSHPDGAVWDAAKAVQLTKTAIEQSPEDVDYWRLLGLAHYRNREFSASQTAIEKAIEIHGEANASDWLVLAMSNWQQGKMDIARQLYRKATDQIAKQPPAGGEAIEFLAEAQKLLQGPSAATR